MMLMHFLFSDEDLLDQDIPAPEFHADIAIEVAKIREAAALLQNSTKFLRDVEPLDEEIPVIKTSVNKLIAGEGRTLADLFDLTGEMSLL